MSNSTPSIASREGEASAALAVHFFTIVLNGQPFIRYHLDVFKTLPFDWHWHIVEGVADLKHDTAWGAANGGRVADDFHVDGRSTDGTSEYLDQLAQQYPDRVTLYRKPPGEFWDGKIEMVNAPLAGLSSECLLWQVDADELWTAEQITLVRDLFLASPEKSAAYFHCRFFVGEELLLVTRGTYASDPSTEWLRCWRFLPGDRWLTHEPPRLCRQLLGEVVDVAAIAPIRHAETEARGVRFQHFAYATVEQLRFKETYYGYRDAVRGWRALQSAPRYPARLRDFFSWVDDRTLVDTASSRNLTPLAAKDSTGEWSFLAKGGKGDLPVTKPLLLAVRRAWFALLYLAIGVRIRVRKSHLLNRVRSRLPLLRMSG